jgi:4-hydroxybenzoate polyprenyltransferase
MNILYSLSLKHKVILDVIAVALGFELRIWAGAVTINIVPSEWLQIFTFLLALFISFAKRREEILSLKKIASEHRRVLSSYRIIFIDQLIAICGGVIILAYALYTLSFEVIRKPKGNYMIYTVPFVVYGVFRYLYLMYMHKEGGDPTEIVISDKPLLINLLVWALSVFIILYLPQ